MNKGKLVGVVAVNRSGELYGQVDSVIVCGKSREQDFVDFLSSCGPLEFTTADVFSQDIFHYLEMNDGAYALDAEAYGVFHPLAVARMLTPVGSFQLGFKDDDMRDYVIFGPSHSDN